MSTEMFCYKILQPGFTLIKEPKLRVLQSMSKFITQENVSKYFSLTCKRLAFVNTCFCFPTLHSSNSKLHFKNMYNSKQWNFDHDRSINFGVKCFSNGKKPPVKVVYRQDLLQKVFQEKQDKMHQTELRIRKSGKLIMDDINKRKAKMKEKFGDLHKTELRIRKSGRLILDDIKETKSKMKEKMGQVIERENVLTVPNLLCVTRIVLSPFLGYLIVNQNFEYALGLVVFAGFTDLLDGWIARTFKNQSSKLGSFLDPMADKVIIATMFLTLTYAEIIPVPLTILIIVRDVLLVGAGFYIRYQSLPQPRTLSRYFDVTHATAELAPTTTSKINTMVQLVTVACTLAAPVFDYVEHPALHALWYLTAGTTVASAVSYILSKNTYRYLRDSKQ